MKKAERNIYRVLTEEANTAICFACKFSTCVAGESPCDCGEPYCNNKFLNEHPYLQKDDDGEPGIDCYFFKPCFTVPILADLVGIILQKGWGWWTVWTNKKGQLKITGTIDR